MIAKIERQAVGNAVFLAAVRLLFRAMESDFTISKLSDVVTISNGKGLHTSQRYSTGPYEVFASGGSVGRYTQTMTTKPMVVIGRKGSAGKATFAADGGWVIDTAYFAQPFEPQELSCKFLYYAILALDFSDDIITTAIPGINRTSIYKHSIPIPPLSIQLDVVSFLEVFSQPSHLELPLLPPSFESERRIIARIEELAAKIEEARGLRREAIEEAKTLISSLHLTLAEGRSVRLNQILALDEQREDVASGGNYPQVGVKGFGQGLFAKQSIDSSQTAYRAFNRLYKGAIVLSQVKGWEGAIAVCTDDALVNRYVSPEYRTFRCIPGESDPEYLASLIATPWFWPQLATLSRGLGDRRERTRPEQFLELELPMPTIDRQISATRLFRKLLPIQALQSETEAELNALLPAVLDRAFRGEL